MKTIRLFGVVLLSMLFSVGLSSCSKSDDEIEVDGSFLSSIEGTWFLRQEKWYSWRNGEVLMGNIMHSGYYTEDTTTKIWEIKKSGKGFLLVENGNDLSVTNLSNNEFRVLNDRFMIKSVTSTEMSVDYIENYYYDRDDNNQFMGFLYFTKK